MSSFTYKVFPGFIKPLISKFSAFLLVLMLIIFLFSSKISPNIYHRLSSKILDSTAPVLGGFSNFINYIINFDDVVNNFIYIKEQNISLKQENELLKYRLKQIKQFESDNIELKKLINFVSDINLKFISTKVVSNSIGPFIHSAIILAGKNHGVKKGQPVINHQGLVGRIIEVGDKTSRVLLVTDINSKIPAITENSRERIIAAGSNFNRLEALYLTDENKIKPGEMVISTGDGEFFPPGLPIGIIVEVKNKMAIVKPIIDVTKLDYVSVVEY
jgi:rod shape-determining protein MreC